MIPTVLLPALLAAVAQAVVVVPSTDATLLANAILGDGITLVSAAYDGALLASGLFTDGPLGIRDAAVLSTGAATDVVPQSDDPGAVRSISNGRPGSSLCEQINGGAATHDAAVLTLEVTLPSGFDGFEAQFVFTTEEYPEWVGSQFNDVFGVFVDGTQIAFDNDNAPITVNGPFFSSSSVLTPPDSQSAFDGSTPLLRSGHAAAPGAHTIQIAICDTADSILDSAVFLAINPCNGEDCAEGTTPVSSSSVSSIPPSSSPVSSPSSSPVSSPSSSEPPSSSEASSSASSHSVYPTTPYPSPAYPTAAYPSSLYPTAGYPSPGYPSPAYSTPGYQSPPYPSPGYPSPAYPSPGYPSPAYPSPGYPSPGYPSPAYPPPAYPSGSPRPTIVYHAPTSQVVYTSTSTCTTTTCPAYGSCHTTIYPTVVTKTSISSYVAPCQTATLTECYRGEGQTCHTKETTITLYPITTYTPGHPVIYVPHMPTYSVPYSQRTETYIPSHPSKPAPCYGKECIVSVYPSETPVYHTPAPPTYSSYPNASIPYAPPQYTGSASSVMPKVAAVMALAAAIAIML